MKKTKACKYCGRRFCRPVYLRDHERVHRGEKPFKCVLCCKSFTAKRNLQQHIKNV